jgi:putative endonuclease
LARAHLEQLGYIVVDVNVRCGGGELDLIAWDGRVLCFVEVRTRASDAWGDPLETLGPDKLRYLVRAASAYLARIPHPGPACRFDAIGVLLPDGAAMAADVTLVRHAFEA